MLKNLPAKRFFSKMLLRMLGAVFLVVYTSAFAQSTPKATLYSFNWQNQPVDKVFKQIEDATKVHFSYNPADVDFKRRINLKVTNKQLNDVIDALANQINVRYKIAGETVMIQALKSNAGAAAFIL
ncbi:MAG: STN domain-containing protein, partial [Bacteroidota bacterium]